MLRIALVYKIGWSLHGVPQFRLILNLICLSTIGEITSIDKCLGMSAKYVNTTTSTGSCKDWTIYFFIVGCTDCNSYLHFLFVSSTLRLVCICELKYQ